MRGNDFLNKMELIDPAYVEAADTKPNKKNTIWIRWAAMAACLCLVAAGAFRISSGKNSRPVLQWSAGFRPESYFQYNMDTDVTPSFDSIAQIPYAAFRDFSDFRSRMEADGVIPAMPNHPLYTCTARYLEDGSISCVTFFWQQRGDAYSDLSITAGYRELEQVQDCIYVEIDDRGNIVPPSVTVTERDGIRIVAEGNEHCNKTLTFQNEDGWYQITGSWGDSYEAMGELLDWVWEHPVNFDLFSMEKGSEMTVSSLEEYPDAFSDLLPDFQAFGYVRGENYLQLKDGTPYSFEGHFYAGVEKSKVDDGSFLFEKGWTEIHWCIDTEPDYYDLQDCPGDISQLSEQQISDVLSEKSSFSFLLDDCFIQVYCKDANAAWAVVASLLKSPA